VDALAPPPLQEDVTVSERPLEAHARRRRNLAQLTALGFRVAEGLPVESGGSTALRPLDEIARRLMALDVLYSFVCAPEDVLPEARIRAHAERNRLAFALTGEERGIFAMTREEANEAHVGVIGWRLENMWPLAWILGFEPAPGVDGRMIPPEIVDPLINAFLPGYGQTVAEFLAGKQIRPEPEVLALEDLFFCAHNAVRGAQLGRPTVPAGFDPVINGGVVHERRRALTWAVSPGVDWVDTDLGT
jgi:hypothetical protein